MYWITGVLGLVLAFGPWLFNYSSNSVALWTSLVVGGAIVIFSVLEGMQADREQWEYWAVGISGLIAIIAPFLFGFGGFANAMWTSVLLGVLITLFAGSRLVSTGKT